MRIGLFSDTFLPIVDGVGRVVLAYAETMSQMGHQVTVSAPLYDTGYRGGMPYDLIDYTAVKVPTQPQYKTGSPLLDTHYRKRIQAASIDIVHAHSPFGAGTEALRIAREKKLPVVASFHSKYYDDFYKVTKNETLSRLLVSSVVSFYNRCDEVWAVSETTAAVLRSYGYKKEIVVVPNGVSLRCAKGEAIKDIETRFGLDGKPLLLFVGQINWKKNILRVLEAAAKLHQEQAQFKLLLAGQGPDEKEVAAKIEELGLSGCAQMIGHVSNADMLDALYARASIFTFPSLYDNAPMVIREAAVMGTPAVLVEGSSAAEIIHDGMNGFLCKDDSDDLYSVLKNALADPGKTKEIGQKARETIPVPWEGIMQTVLERYQALIDGPYRRKPGSRKRSI